MVVFSILYKMFKKSFNARLTNTQCFDSFSIFVALNTNLQHTFQRKVAKLMHSTRSRLSLIFLMRVSYCPMECALY